MILQGSKPERPPEIEERKGEAHSMMILTDQLCTSSSSSKGCNSVTSLEGQGEMQPEELEKHQTTSSESRHFEDSMACE